MIQFFLRWYTPEIGLESASAGASLTDTNDSPATSAELRADDDLFAVCTDVSKAWKADPSITLKWTTQSDFDALTVSFGKSIDDKDSVATGRPAQTKSLSDLDDEIDTAAGEVKNYIRKKFKTAGANAQFSRYGFAHRGDHWDLPRDRQHRQKALNLMQAAITADGFKNEEYGDSYWSQIITDYTDALEAAQDTDKVVSGNVADKKVVRPQIRKTLTALRFVLRGNYPDTYEQVYRMWGWQKEDY